MLNIKVKHDFIMQKVKSPIIEVLTTNCICGFL